jgi:PAS domain S-box-containing protein
MLYEKAPLGYQSLDENGHFIVVNQTWLDTLGYTREEVIGKSFADFLHPEGVMIRK